MCSYCNEVNVVANGSLQELFEQPERLPPMSFQFKGLDE